MVTEEPKDKRTKAYKEWVKNHSKQSSGLGDEVAKVTKALGIQKAFKFVLGKDCGCDERQKKLNEIFPSNKPNCLVEEEYKYLTDFFNKKSSYVTPFEQKKLYSIYNRIFNQNKQTSSCGTCVANVIKELKKYLNFYDVSDKE